VETFTINFYELCWPLFNGGTIGDAEGKLSFITNLGKIWDRTSGDRIFSEY